MGGAVAVVDDSVSVPLMEGRDVVVNMMEEDLVVQQHSCPSCVWEIRTKTRIPVSHSDSLWCFREMHHSQLW